MKEIGDRITRITKDPFSHDALLAIHGLKNICEVGVARRILENQDKLTVEVNGKLVPHVVQPWGDDGIQILCAKGWDDTMAVFIDGVKMESKCHGRYIGVTRNGVF